MVMLEVEKPSCGTLAGDAVTRSASASCEGPVNGGGSVLWTVQPALPAIAATTAKRRMFVQNMILVVPKVSEIDLDLTGDADVVADAVAAVEGHPPGGDDDVRAGAKFGQRRFLLGRVAHDLEPDR